MSTLDEKIILELSNYVKPVKYSEIRDKFKDEPNFLERLCFLISIGDVCIFGYGNEESKYPEEVDRIITVQRQYNPNAGKGVRIDKVKEYVYTLLTGREPEDSSITKGQEPFLFYKPTGQN
ncbi:MAG: hypothetical protein QXP77_00790 [Candidatus Aenigmatarchaeota archaeon]